MSKKHLYSDDMKQAKEDKKELLDKIEKASVTDIEDFLGYPITQDILKSLRKHLEEVYEQMPQEEIEAFEQKFDMTPSDKYF